MSKSVLVIDTPINCRVCPLKTELNGYLNYCFTGEELHVDVIYAHNRLDDCPLKPTPQRIEQGYPTDDYTIGKADGWNACILQITGETECI